MESRRTMTAKGMLAGWTAGLLLLPGLASAQPLLANMDFEAGAPGAAPPEWRLSGMGGALAVVTGNPAAGRQAARLSGQQVGAIRRLEAAPYRGRLLMVEAAIRMEGAAAGQLFLRADAGASPLLLATTNIAGETWKRYRAVITVPAGADGLSFGFSLANGAGVIDDVSLRPLTPHEAGYEASRPLTPRGLENLAAFTRLLGYVRFFHPSDQSAAADWDGFAIAGVQQVERARNARELAAVLQTLFLPLAPTLEISAGSLPAARPVPACTGCDLVRWRHTGAGLKIDPAYKSERVAAMAAETPVEAALGGGVFARVPLTLPRDASGTLPHGTMPVIAPGKPAGFAPSGNDRATRLADIALAWPIFQHFYPYFDVAKTDWPAQLREALNRAARDPDDTAFRETLRRMVASLKDGHGNVNYGIPRYLPLSWELVEHQLVITGVAAGQGGGLRRGDVVLRIGGRDVGDVMRRLEPQVSAATPGWHRLILLRLLSEATEPVTLTAQHAGGAIFETRLDPALPAPLGYEERPARLGALRDGLWYVDLARIAQADLTPQALSQLAAAKAVIIDNRLYRQDAAAVRTLLSRLAPTTLHGIRLHVPLITRPDGARDASPEGWDLVIDPAAPHIRGHLVFLADANGVSSTESYMSAITGGKLGPVVGENTAGTDGEIDPFALPGGYTVVWTGMKVTKQDGAPLHGVGFAPDYPVARTLAGIRAGRDEILERGIEVAMKEIADDR